jgi:hypothetical protein
MGDETCRVSLCFLNTLNRFQLIINIIRVIYNGSILLENMICMYVCIGMYTLRRCHIKLFVAHPNHADKKTLQNKSVNFFKYIQNEIETNVKFLVFNAGLLAEVSSHPECHLIGQLDQVLQWSSSALDKMLIWCQRLTFYFMLHMNPS